MSEWTDLAPTPKAATTHEPVRFGMSKIRGAKARGVLLLRREVIDQLDMKHWRVAIRIGSGARAHQIAVVPDDNGLFTLDEVGTAKKGGTWRVRLPVVDRFPDIASPALGRSWKIEQDGKRKILVIDLPPYCFDEGSKRRAVAAAQTARAA